MNGPALPLVHALATAMMAGLIWFVQIVHYPLYARVGQRDFERYESEHLSRTGAVVMPLMLTELATAILLLFAPLDDARRALAWAGFALVVALWLSTFLVQVPCHRRLATGFDARAHRRLVRSNWFRTAAWTARAVIALLILDRAA